MENAEMQVTYTLTAGDIKALSGFVAQKTKRWSKLAAVVGLVIFGIPVLTLLLNPKAHRDTAHVLNYFAGFLLGVIPPLLIGAVFLFLILQNSYRTADRMFPGAFDPRTVILAPDAFISREKTGELRLYWNMLNCLEENRDYIFVLQNQARGFVIPKRAFANPGEAERFYQRATELKVGESSKPPANPW